MLYSKLFHWQKRIIDEYEDMENFLLYLDMGLGKTPVALAFAEVHESDKIIIISVDKKVQEDENINGSFVWWGKQMEIPYNFYTKKYNFNGEGPKKWYREISPETKDVLLINYDALYKRKTKFDEDRSLELSSIVSDFINSCRNNTVTIICDECHKLKELDSLRTKSVKKIQRELRLKKNKVYTYLATGTPFTQGYEDLYSQLKLVGWEESKEFFRNQFCILGQVYGLLGWQQPIVGYKNIDQLYNVIHRFGITIKSESVVDLPQQVFMYHKIPNSKEMTLLTSEKLKKEIIEEYIKDNNLVLPYALNEAIRNGKINNPFFRNIDFPETKWLAETAAAFWMRSRQLSIGFQGNTDYYKWYNKNRLEKLKELLEDNPDNYVLFYNYDCEFFEIFEICESLGYKVDVCNGSIKSEYFYQKYIKQSEAEKLTNTKNIIIANFASGSAGGNWQGYNKCILFSLPVFSDYQQSIKRVHRIGQHSTVVYHVFYSENWLDERMLASIRESKEYDEKMFEGDLKRVQELLSSSH